MIHEQVQMQLDYLKVWVDGEKETQKRCEKLKIPYVPSNRQYENERQYRLYAKEIEQNGDKNLLVMAKVEGQRGLNMYGTYPFAIRYADDNRYLVHRTKYGAEILLKTEDIEIVKN